MIRFLFYFIKMCSLVALPFRSRLNCAQALTVVSPDPLRQYNVACLLKSQSLSLDPGPKFVTMQ